MTETLPFALEQRIYNTYRQAVRSFRQAATGSTARAAERRNRARKIAVNRYNVSFQQVKAIVAKFDELNNVEHPDDPHYRERMDFLLAREAYRQNPVDSCPACGSTENIDLRVDPYEIEIHQTISYTISCYLCYYTLELDI